MLVLTFASGSSFAQIYYHDIAPDTTVSTWNAFQLYPSVSMANNLTLWWHPAPEVVAETNGNCEILYTGGLPAKLQAGDTIGATGTWNAASYDALNSGGTGNWQTAATDKYLAFRFKNSTTWYYGWLKMSVATGAASFTVKEWAYNSTGNPIKAGQTSMTTAVQSVKGDNPGIAVAGNRIMVANTNAGSAFSVDITDMNGRIIQKATLTSVSPIDLSNFAAGIYILRLYGDGYSGCLKVPVK